MINTALAVGDTIPTGLSLTDITAILAPLIINGALAAYLFGGVSQKIKALEADLVNMRYEMERVKDANNRTESNLHRVEIILSRIEARFDMFLTSDHPMIRDAIKRTTYPPPNNE